MIGRVRRRGRRRGGSHLLGPVVTSNLAAFRPVSSLPLSLLPPFLTLVYSHRRFRPSTPTCCKCAHHSFLTSFSTLTVSFLFEQNNHHTALLVLSHANGSNCGTIDRQARKQVSYRQKKKKRVFRLSFDSGQINNST